MNQENGTGPARAKPGEGFLHRFFDRAGHAPPQDAASSAQAGALQLEDIQGLVVRGYRMPLVRHFLLSVGVPAQARRLLGRLVSGDEADAPQITTAEEWQVGFAPGPNDDPSQPARHKPDYCLNLGVTWAGLMALELKERVPELSFKSFDAFVAGAAARASRVGDTGASAPQNWIDGFGGATGHLLLTLHALDRDALAPYGDRLVALFADGDALREVWRRDGEALTETADGQRGYCSRVHFGYTDGVSATTLRGGPQRYTPDHQQPCEPWLFVLMDEAENYSASAGAERRLGVRLTLLSSGRTPLCLSRRSERAR